MCCGSRRGLAGALYLAVLSKRRLVLGLPQCVMACVGSSRITAARQVRDLWFDAIQRSGKKRPPSMETSELTSLTARASGLLFILQTAFRSGQKEQGSGSQTKAASTPGL